MLFNLIKPSCCLCEKDCYVHTFAKEIRLCNNCGATFVNTSSKDKKFKNNYIHKLLCLFGIKRNDIWIK